MVSEEAGGSRDKDRGAGIKLSGSLQDAVGQGREGDTRESVRSVNHDKRLLLFGNRGMVFREHIEEGFDLGFPVIRSEEEPES